MKQRRYLGDGLQAAAEMEGVMLTNHEITCRECGEVLSEAFKLQIRTDPPIYFCTDCWGDKAVRRVAIASPFFVAYVRFSGRS